MGAHHAVVVDGQEGLGLVRLRRELGEVDVARPLERQRRRAQRRRRHLADDVAQQLLVGRRLRRLRRRRRLAGQHAQPHLIDVGKEK